MSFWIDSTANNQTFFYGVKNALTDDLIAQLDHWVDSEHLLQPAGVITYEKRTRSKRSKKSNNRNSLD